MRWISRTVGRHTDPAILRALERHEEVERHLVAEGLEPLLQQEQIVPAIDREMTVVCGRLFRSEFELSRVNGNAARFQELGSPKDEVESGFGASEVLKGTGRPHEVEPAEIARKRGHVDGSGLHAPSEFGVADDMRSPEG